MLTHLFAFCALTLSFSACTFTPPSRAEIQAAEIGEPPDEETAKVAARWVIEPFLRDASTALFEYPAEIRRGYVTTFENQNRFAWALPMYITDRTSRGTYGNARLFEFHFLDDAMIAWTLAGRRTGGRNGSSEEFLEPMPLAPFRDGSVPEVRPKARKPEPDLKAN